MAKTNNSYTSKLYAKVAAKHPEMTQKQIYRTVGLILADNKNKKAQF